jgi:hypothetical protein
MLRALRPREKRLSRDGTFLSIPTLSPVGHVHPSRDGTFLSIPTLSSVGHVHPSRDGTFLSIPTLSPVGHVQPPLHDGTFLSLLTPGRSRAGGSEPRKKLRF